jgi:hypothetical protein
MTSHDRIACRACGIDHDCQEWLCGSCWDKFISDEQRFKMYESLIHIANFPTEDDSLPGKFIAM